MITGMPLSAIGLLRQAALEATARTLAGADGRAGSASVTLEIAQPADGDAGTAGAGTPRSERHRIDVLV